MIEMIEIRDPIHGFIELNQWEKEIIDDPIFQRLRRIRQLGFTDMVYPSAMHSRFEHSLGVMHLAIRMFDQITKTSAENDLVIEETVFTKEEIKRDRVLLRLSCLLHDLGHPPFSHAGEGLMPVNEAKAKLPGTQKFYKHEDYSTAIIRFLMEGKINGHRLNKFDITAEEIANFLNRDPEIGKHMLWTDLISGQIDADRADYLLRDSHHLGVAYGHYDLERLISTLTITGDKETGAARIVVEEGGEHAAEALIIARYMMFTQVYFHKTRRIYDFHLTEALKNILLLARCGSEEENITAFPPPKNKENIDNYLYWDDWRVLSAILNNQAGEHGQIILERKHYRSVFETPDTDIEADEELIKQVKDGLTSAGIPNIEDNSDKSWYETGEKGDKDIRILLRPGKSDQKLTTLSSKSAVVKELINKTLRSRIYVPFENKEESTQIIEGIRKKGRD